MKFDTFAKLWKDESGATAIEYGLIAALVCLQASIHPGKAGVAWPPTHR